MKVYYVTIDETNAQAMLLLAASCGVEVAGPRDLAWLQERNAEVVLDWDFLPGDERARLVDDDGRLRLVGLHGYGLSDSVAGFLRRAGVLVSGRLDEEFVRALLRQPEAA